jgi:endogenous inhibitor of DNA gyrase (YacG/DUF329 family)
VFGIEESECAHCGADITGRRTYCSNRCRQAAYRDRWPSFHKEYQQRCWECGTPVVQPATGRHREYCSNACRQAAHRLRMR